MEHNSSTKSSKRTRNRLCSAINIALIVSMISGWVAFEYYYTPEYIVPSNLVQKSPTGTSAAMSLENSVLVRAIVFRKTMEFVSRTELSPELLTEFAKEFFPTGTSFEKAEEMLRAAGFSLTWFSNVPYQEGGTTRLEATMQATHFRHSDIAIHLTSNHKGAFTTISSQEIKRYKLAF